MSLQYEKSEEIRPQMTPEEYLRKKKSELRRRAYWFIGFGVLIVVFHVVAVLMQAIELRDLFRSILFILGLIAFAGGIWTIYYAKKLTFQDLIPTQEAVEFARQSQTVKPYFTYILVGAIVAVTLVQMATGLDKSIEAAGFVKPDFLDKGEYWRILTGGALHGGFLHIYFNAQALYGFGNLIEYFSNRAHLAIVFVLAIVGGGLLSLLFLPEGISVGASGGIMGLIGYLAIYGYRRKQQLPPDFLKSMLINIGFIAAFGIIAYQIVDNFGHLGGLTVGAIYGFVQIPKNLHKNPRSVGMITELVGYAALGVFLFTCILSILLILQIVRL